MQRTMGNIPFFRIVQLSSWGMQKASCWLHKITFGFSKSAQSDCLINCSWEWAFKIKLIHEWWREEWYVINCGSLTMIGLIVVLISSDFCSLISYLVFLFHVWLCFFQFYTLFY
jgi:hypothetical protein